MLRRGEEGYELLVFVSASCNSVPSSLETFDVFISGKKKGGGDFIGLNSRFCHPNDPCKNPIYRLTSSVSCL